VDALNYIFFHHNPFLSALHSFSTLLHATHTHFISSTHPLPTAARPATPPPALAEHLIYTVLLSTAFYLCMVVKTLQLWLIQRNGTYYIPFYTCLSHSFFLSLSLTAPPSLSLSLTTTLSLSFSLSFSYFILLSKI